MKRWTIAQDREKSEYKNSCSLHAQNSVLADGEGDLLAAAGKDVVQWHLQLAAQDAPNLDCWELYRGISAITKLPESFKISATKLEINKPTQIKFVPSTNTSRNIFASFFFCHSYQATNAAVV